ncbi:MAG: hypothetical protein HKN11_19505 [Rhizobiales bacterium]|nr:hypothetical protein [Hyphomicrobiales bacterium]
MQSIERQQPWGRFMMMRRICHLGFVIAASGLAFCAGALSQETGTAKTYDVVSPPACTNYKGETVQFIDRSTANAGTAAGMANRDSSGTPIVVRSNFAATTPAYQSFIDRHECAHHQSGDVDRPHPPRNSPEHLMNEAISDCIAILRLRDEEGYDEAAVGKVTAAMRREMAKIGFPEISISSRISNIDNCYAKYGAAKEFIEGVLKQRGLLQP